MNFDFSDEQKLLGETVRDILRKEEACAGARKALDGDLPFDIRLWRVIVDLGLPGAAIPPEFGGSGLGYLELCVIAEELGRALAAVPFASTVFLFAEALQAAGTETQKGHWLPKIARGECIGTVGGSPIADGNSCRVEDGSITGTLPLVVDGLAADVAIVTALGADGRAKLWLVDLSAAGVRRSAVETIDPTRPLTRVIFNDVPVEAFGQALTAEDFVRDLFDKAAVLVAFEQLGGAEGALEMARDHALARFAFGRPIGSFQAIKHKLADLFVSCTLARSNAYFAAWALAAGDVQLAVAAAAARVSATDAFLQCAAENIQVHGGTGFTWDSDCHLYYRRASTLSVLLGPMHWWEAELVKHLRHRQRVEECAA